MNINDFNKLVEGHLPPHHAGQLDSNSFFLQAQYGEGAPPGFASIERPERVPVLRHGPMVAHILDTAASSSGPLDPKLFSLLENDDMAQVAHHVSEALRYAVQYYRYGNRTGGSFGQGFGRDYGGGGGFGRGGKRPHDGGYGGGYSRPPFKRGGMGGWGHY